MTIYTDIIKLNCLFDRANFRNYWFEFTDEGFRLYTILVRYI